MRANASPVSMKVGPPLANLPGRRSSSATIQRAALEVELKLDVTTEPLNILKSHPLFRYRRSSRKDEVVSLYLDTEDSAFRRHGLSFRLRRKGGKVLQTIKGPYRGVRDRSERETPFTGDAHFVAANAFMRRLDRNVPTALKPVFKARVEREAASGIWQEMMV